MKPSWRDMQVGLAEGRRLLRFRCRGTNGKGPGNRGPAAQASISSTGRGVPQRSPLTGVSLRGILIARNPQTRLSIFPGASQWLELGRWTDRNILEILVPQEGFEPPTPSLRMMCSTS
jgi:hypothetical protein